MSDLLKILVVVFFTYITVQCSQLPVTVPANTIDAENPDNSTDNAGNSADESPTTTVIPTTEDQWTIVYNGYGSVNFDSENGIVMEPQPPTGSNTHAALVLAKTTQENPIKDFRTTIVYSTNAQLRAASPNSWEVFWLFFNFNFRDPNNISSGELTNYFIFKTNGIELGRAFDDDAATEQQVFLYTASTPQIVISQTYTLTLEKRSQNLDVYINNILIFSYTGSASPDVLYDVPGMIALYTEDARVTVYSVNIENWD